MMQRMHRQTGIKFWFTLALVAGALLRVFFIAHHARFGGDTLVYGDLAHNMLAHHIFGFTEDRIRPTLIRLPGYPVFLAACFLLFGTANYLAVLWVQLFIDLGTCVLLGLLANRLLGYRAAVATVWLAALCPFTANYSAVALTETLCLFCLAVTLYALYRWIEVWKAGDAGLGWAALTGCGLIYGVLLRPDQALVAMVVVPAMLWVGVREGKGDFGRRILPAVIASAFLVVPLSFWALRNWRAYHVFQPLAPRYANDPGEANPSGFQRWYRTWAIDFEATFQVYWVYDGGAVDVNVLPARAFDSPPQRAETENLFAQYNEVTSSNQQLDDEFASIAAERIRTHPLRYYVVMPVARELDMWLRPRTELMALPGDFWNVADHPGDSWFEYAYAALNAGYLLLAVIGLVRWRAKGWSGFPVLAFTMVGFVALRCVLLLTLDNSEPRYTLECFPVVILLAGFVFARTNAQSSVRQA